MAMGYACLALRPIQDHRMWGGLTGDARSRFFESLLEEQVRRARSDDGRL